MKLEDTIIQFVFDVSDSTFMLTDVSLMDKGIMFVHI